MMMLNEFEQISKEIHAWAQYDQEYTQMLIVYAHQKGYITAEQAEASIADLKKWWEDNEPENEHIKENKHLTMLLEMVGSRFNPAIQQQRIEKFNKGDNDDVK